MLGLSDNSPLSRASEGYVPLVGCQPWPQPWQHPPPCGNQDPEWGVARAGPPGKRLLPLQGLGVPTRAGLAGEWKLLDLWGGGVAVIVRLVDPPVWSLPKEDPEKKGERGL